MTLHGPDGIRQAMRDSYQKHLTELAGRPLPDGSSLHQAALYGALATRQMAGGEFRGEPAVWLDLLPFMHLGEGEGIEMLSEYVLFKEMPNAANTAKLGPALKRGLSLLTSVERDMLVIAEGQGFAWTTFLGD
jgi:hypothetical protein